MLKASRYLFYSFVCLSVVFISCKTSKKQATKAKLEQEKVEASRIEKAKGMLLPIVNGKSKLSKSEMVKVLDQVDAMGIDDTEIVDMLKKAKAKVYASEAKSKKPIKKTTPEGKLEYNFDKIANSKNFSKAKQVINSTTKMFTSDNTPVLLIISSENGVVDYDKPTTIKDYLNYLRDRKESPNKVHDIVKDSTGKIKELVLIAK